MPMILTPSSSPTLLDIRKVEIPALRKQIVAALYRDIEGMSDERLAMQAGVDEQFMRLILADACVEGELIKVVEVLDEVITEHPGEERPFHLHATVLIRYRLSYEKWVEMEAAA